MSYKQMKNLDLEGKRVLIREDLNVPVKNGKVENDTRIQAAILTIDDALRLGAKVMVMSHLGRPEEGKSAAEQPQFSLRPVASCLKEMLHDREVALVSAEDYLTGRMPPLDSECIALLENVRFNKGEKANDDDLAKRYANLCDIFVMDAFGTAHRAQASTHGVARYASEVCAGPLLSTELKALSLCLENPALPMLAIVGGAKVSSKLKVLQNLAPEVDQLIVGGGIANTFLAAAGHHVGRSLYEPQLTPIARQLMRQTTIPLPIDVVVANQPDSAAQAKVRLVSKVQPDEMILDIGPQTIKQFEQIITNMRTILWNGPVGMFELSQFANGTKSVATAIAQSKAFSMAGGGETIAAIDKFGITHYISKITRDAHYPCISYTSTGGGAFLEYVQGTQLPAVQILKERG